MGGKNQAPATPELVERLKRLRQIAESATEGPWATDGTVILSKAPWPLEDGPGWQDWETKGGEPMGRFVAETRTAEAEGERNAEFLAAFDPPTILELISFVEAASDDDWFGEWTATTSARIRDNESASAKLEASQALADRYEKALTEVRDLEPVPFEGGLDWSAIGACEDCQNYKDHPLMRGICNTHRRPLHDRESHDSREEKRLGWRAKCIAREALSSQGRHEGGEDGLPELPCGVGPSDLTDPQSQHSDGGRDV